MGELTVTVHVGAYYVMTMKQADLQIGMAAVLEALVADFFGLASITVGVGEDATVSLVLPARAVRKVPKACGQICETPWTVLEVSEGSGGWTSHGLVHGVSKELQSSGVSILYLSTDDQDFVLVPTRSVEVALECLRSSHNAEVLDMTQENSTVVESGLTPQELELRSLYQESGPATDFSPSPANRRRLRLPGQVDYVVVGMPIHGPQVLDIVRFLFGLGDTSAFDSIGNSPLALSVTRAEKTWSVILPASIAESIGLNLESGNLWRAILVDEGSLGFEMTGVVVSISAPLSCLPLFYLSTFSTDVVLVPLSDAAEAESLLEESNHFILSMQ